MQVDLSIFAENLYKMIVEKYNSYARENDYPTINNFDYMTWMPCRIVGFLSSQNGKTGE